MPQVSHVPNYAASVRVARAASHLHQANQQLAAATHAKLGRYCQHRLRRLMADLRELSLPLAGIALRLERGGGQ